MCGVRAAQDGGFRGKESWPGWEGRKGEEAHEGGFETQLSGCGRKGKVSVQNQVRRQGNRVRRCAMRVRRNKPFDIKPVARFPSLRSCQPHYVRCLKMYGHTEYVCTIRSMYVCNAPSTSYSQYIQYFAHTVNITCKPVFSGERVPRAAPRGYSSLQGACLLQAACHYRCTPLMRQPTTRRTSPWGWVQ